MILIHVFRIYDGARRCVRCRVSVLESVWVECRR